MTTTKPTAFAQQLEDQFAVTNEFVSYVSKPEITNLLPNYLVKGSKNVLIDYANRVISRNGYTLYNQANTGKGRVRGSYEWETSSGSQFSLRSWDTTLEFDWNGMYNTLLTNLRSSYIEFATVLDYNEQQDILLFVNGDGPQMHRWSGGVSTVRSSTSTTLRKQGVIGPRTLGICTISNGSNALVTINNHGLLANDTVVFSVSSGGALPTGITAGTTYYVISSGLDTNDFEISTTQGGTAVTTSTAGSGVFVVQKINDASCTKFTFTAGDGLMISPTITDANGNFLNAGFAAGDTINISGSVSNNSNFTVASVTATVLTLLMDNVLVNESDNNSITIYNQTGPTWKFARFFSTISSRAITYNGVSYAYTAGEVTDTLVGLSSFPFYH